MRRSLSPTADMPSRTSVADKCQKPKSDWKESIEFQGRPKLVVTHARQVISWIDLFCAAKEELLESLESKRTQRINDAAKGDPHEEPVRAWDGDKLKVIWEDSHPIRNEVIL